ncbi:ankyrin [Hypoxylon sp. EC38]|nr:ankyrin [Hypoxylon sp. EC38]
MRRNFPKSKQPPINVLSPQVYNNLLSEEIFVGEEQIRFDMLSSDDAVECRLYTRLITSMINGYSGLEGIPAPSVLRFLTRHHNIRSTLFHFLRSNSKYAAKSLAESTFQAAIEADDVNVAKLLIELRLVDANETVCFVGAGRRTPLEKAAIEQSFGIIRLLLNLNVDINKSYPKKLRFPQEPKSSALECLIDSNHDSDLTLNDNFLGLVADFVKAGAPISAKLMESVFRFVDPRLALFLTPKFISKASRRLFQSINLLTNIITNFDEKDAIATMKLLAGRGFLEPDEMRLPVYSFNSALAAAARRGSLELVKVLLPYSSHLHEAFKIAIKDKNQDMIDMILNERRDPKEIATVGTLVAAFTSGHQDLFRFLEENGALSRSIGSQLDKAITAALEAGNLIFANKLLDCNPEFKGNTLANTIRTAVAHGYDDFACKLIATGADYVSSRRLTSRGPLEAMSSRDLISLNALPLLVAIEKGKPQVVRVMLEASNLKVLFSAGIYSTGHSGSFSILDAAIECGDGTILSDILEACSRVICLPKIEGALECAFNRGELDLFWKIIKLRRHDPHCLSAALNFAVGREDIPLLNELFDVGARSDDKKALEKAVLGHPSMIEPLLKQFRQGHPRGYSGYGISALSTAVKHYPKCAEGLNMLLAFKLIDVNSIDCAIDEAILNRPLGIAIRGKYGQRVIDNNLELVERLLDAGGNPNIITSVQSNDPYYVQTAFLDAIETGSTKMVLLLLQHGARVNEPASFGLRRTPLQKAVEVRSLEIVRLLLEKDAKVNAPPAFCGGATELQLAAIGGNCTIATILIEHGARLDIPPPPGKDGRWPLEGAAENGRLDMIQLIWYANNRRLDKEQCRKAMRLAEYKGHIACRDLIADLMSAIPAVS